MPLCEGSFVFPPTPDSFWDLQEIHQIVWSNLSPENEKTLWQLTRKHKINEAIVFSLPRPSGGHTLFGISFQRIRQAHPLSGDGYAGVITPIVLERRDRDYLLPRGGAHVGLQKKHVALIGCGAVGGFVALEMGRAGILSLTLVDRETVTADNSYRHVLGREAIREPKSHALRDEIQRKLPYAQAISIHNSVEAAIDQGKFRPARYDLIVVAIGDETTSLYLNEFFQSTSGTPPVIFTWLDPYGIGGHALLTNNGESPGCFECLFTPVSPELATSLHNRASFAASGQSFAKDLSGCGTLFTPYGSIDATNTAVLATRMVIDSLFGQETGNPLLSWKGSARQFLQAGYSLSDRYYLSEADLFEHRYGYANSHCSVCGSPI